MLSVANAQINSISYSNQPQVVNGQVAVRGNLQSMTPVQSLMTATELQTVNNDPRVANGAFFREVFKTNPFDSTIQPGNAKTEFLVSINNGIIGDLFASNVPKDFDTITLQLSAPIGFSLTGEGFTLSLIDSSGLTRYSSGVLNSLSTGGLSGTGFASVTITGNFANFKTDFRGDIGFNGSNGVLPPGVQASIIYSKTIPEPSTIAIACFGGLLLVTIMGRQRKQVRS